MVYTYLGRWVPPAVPDTAGKAGTDSAASLPDRRSSEEMGAVVCTKGKNMGRMWELSQHKLYRRGWEN